MRRHFYLSLAVFLIETAICSGQSYYFRHYQVEQGLSNNTVFSSVQDGRGFLWMGTKDGLNRFDGYSFKVFRNDPDDSTSLGDNFTRSLFISSDTLYAGTRNGLYRYNPLLENFTIVYKTGEEVRDIKKDKLGNVWFVAGQTLHRTNENTGKTTVFDAAKFFNATSIAIDRSNVVWVSTADGLLQKYSIDGNNFTSFDLFAKTPSASPKWIEKIFAMEDGEILAGTSNYGVKSFNPSSYSYRDIITTNPDRTSIFARDFVQTSTDEIWIATESGIFIYNKVSGEAINLKKQYGNPYSISDNAVYTLYRDREGGIWAGTYFGGANYYPKQHISFEKYFPGYNNYSLSGNAVREICEDKYGDLWIGTEDAGLNKLNKKTGTITQFQPSGTSKDISYPNIHGLLAKGDELWIGTFEHGLDILDIRTGEVIRHFPGDSNSNELRSNFIVVIYQTLKGEIYIGTRQGLYMFNNVSRQFKIVTQVPSTCFVHSILEDREGNMWIGTMSSGLFYFNPITGSRGNFVYDAKNRKGINSSSVTTIFESTSGDLWIGTEGGGLCKFNRQDSSFSSFTLKEGFPSNTVFRILEDEHKKLWITTSNGLVSFSPEKGSLSIYTTANGLLSNQFNYNSGFRDGQGKMYFGSAKGLISFNPDNFIVTKFSPPVYITGLYINDKELLANADKSPLKRAISYTDEVELSYDDASFSIDFAALSFTAPEMTEYKYITEGLDKDWTYLKTNRKVYFTNLSPGTYTFRVRAGTNGIWTDQEAKITIVVMPPFWASPLAYFIYALLSIALAVILIRSYHQRVKERTRRKLEFMEHEKEKELYQAKINFFTNVAHEIKTPLTLIKAPMEQIAKKAGENSGFDYDLMIMQRNTDRLLELTNQLLDFRKIETTGFRLNFVLSNITELLMERYSSFKLLSDQKNIHFEIDVPDTPVMAYVDTDSIQKILNNLLYNALNYCSRRVQIKLFSLHQTKDHFEIEVRNDGRQIPAEMKEKIFEPFVRLSENAGKPGSGIGLALSRSLADLHKGSIILREPRHGMNIFVLSLPVNQKIN